MVSLATRRDQCFNSDSCLLLCSEWWSNAELYNRSRPTHDMIPFFCVDKPLKRSNEALRSTDLWHWSCLKSRYCSTKGQYLKVRECFSWMVEVLLAELMEVVRRLDWSCCDRTLTHAVRCGNKEDLDDARVRLETNFFCVSQKTWTHRSVAQPAHCWHPLRNHGLFKLN